MIADSILAAANLPREQSQTLPAGAYTDPAFHAFENAEIFHKEWISLCHVSQIPKPGDFVRVDLCGEPMLVVRGKDMDVRVLSRTCRHRGMDVMPSGFGHPDEGNKRVILCPYHLWSYDLGGKLIGAPEMRQAEGFDRSEVCLHEFRSEIWEGFVFATLSADTPPVAEKYARLKNNFVGKWRIADAEVVWSAHWDCGFNWKILIENFMECYHHMGAHMKTLEPFLPARGCWTEPCDPDFSCMHLPLKPSMKEEILAAGDAGTPFPVFPGLGIEDCTEWSIYLGYPNFLLFNAPDRVYWYRILPTGPTTSSLFTTMLISKSAREMPDFETILQREIQAGIDFHLEDMEMCTATQRGIQSAGYAPGRLSHLEETIWQFQKYLAAVIRRSEATRKV
jgi:phenylpropionate dioxygenase-like ring-hydroxylating dioxygenase large terminal subunit